MRIQIMSRARLESSSFPGLYALISFRDPLTAEVVAPPPCGTRLDIVCHDIAETCPGLTAPAADDAAAIVAFVRGLPTSATLIVQCEAGVGRSVATAAVLGEWAGAPGWKQLLRHGTHNRRLHALLLAALGLPPRVEPLVALVVRLKYPADRMGAFVHAMARQRYDNWRCVFVSDGPFVDAWDEYGIDMDHRLAIITTPERRGLWGHPWRQRGIDAALELEPAYIGLSNDDNYYTPGYLEQMVGALEDRGARLALCDYLHAYSGWAVVPGIPTCGTADVGNWLADARLIRATPWQGTGFAADGEYVERLAKAAGPARVCRVGRVLFVKN